jgi:hypothetical protein
MYEKRTKTFMALRDDTAGERACVVNWQGDFFGVW